MSDISSLGIGSGVLTADVIDQLKAADEARIVKPIERKITLNNQRQDAEKLLSSLMDTFKTSVSALSYDTLFDKKNVTVDGSSAKVKVDDGATVDSFTIETVKLAKQDIQKFGEVDSKNAIVADGSGTLNIAMGTKSFDIAYTAQTSLSELAQAITEKAGKDIAASVLQTGDGKYSLVLSSKTTGADQAMTMTDPDGNLKDAFFANGLSTVQAATDSEFKYNDITVTRSTNEITDLVLGVNIELLKTDDAGKHTDVNIKQDQDAITGEMQLFVDSYNTLMSNIHDMTLKDKETGAEGVFNGSNFVKSIQQTLTSSIMEVGPDNNSLVNYGISLNRSGTMSFDKSVLEKALTKDSAAVELFFVGGTNTVGDKQEGLFTKVDEKVKSYTGYGKLLDDFKDSLETEGKDYSAAYKSAQDSLDARYGIMTKRFIAYDAIISKINAQFSSLQMMINAENN